MVLSAVANAWPSNVWAVAGLGALTGGLTSGVRLRNRYPSDRLLVGPPALYSILLVVVPAAVAGALAFVHLVSAVVGGLATPVAVQGRKGRPGDSEEKGIMSTIETGVSFLDGKLNRELRKEREKFYQPVLKAVDDGRLTWLAFAENMTTKTEDKKVKGEIVAALHLTQRETESELGYSQHQRALLDVAYKYRWYDVIKRVG
jgi:hypothetical protein